MVSCNILTLSISLVTVSQSRSGGRISELEILLEKKPKEVIKEVEVIKEIPVEVIKEVEKVVEKTVTKDMDKVKMLQETIQKLQNDLREKKENILQLENNIVELKSMVGPKKAKISTTSNLGDNLYK